MFVSNHPFISHSRLLLVLRFSGLKGHVEKKNLRKTPHIQSHTNIKIY